MFRTLNLSRDEKGQSIVEVSVGLIFLLLIIIIVFEAGIMFSTYIALLNAARDGAVYASSHSQLDPNDPEQKESYDRYEGTIRAEAFNGGLTDPTRLTILPPEMPDGSDPGEPIVVRVTYRVETFTSSISLPFFGRMGLPYYWPVTATAIMPIR